MRLTIHVELSRSGRLRMRDLQGGNVPHDWLDDLEKSDKDRRKDGELLIHRNAVASSHMSWLWKRLKEELADGAQEYARRYPASNLEFMHQGGSRFFFKKARPPQVSLSVECRNALLPQIDCTVTHQRDIQEHPTPPITYTLCIEADDAGRVYLRSSPPLPVPHSPATSSIVNVEEAVTYLLQLSLGKAHF
jgi:hypothetical protein